MQLRPSTVLYWGVNEFECSSQCLLQSGCLQSWCGLSFFSQVCSEEWKQLKSIECSYCKNKLVCSMVLKTQMAAFEISWMHHFVLLWILQNVVNMLNLQVSRNYRLLWLLFSLQCQVALVCARAHPTSTDLIFSSWLCLLPFPSLQCSFPQHRRGRKLPCNWVSTEIRRGLGSLHLIMQGSTLKILPKWVVSCIFLQGDWGGKNTKTPHNTASASEMLKQCRWRHHRLISPSSSHQGRIYPWHKEAGRTFRSYSGN